MSPVPMSPAGDDPIRILVADDHVLLREALCELLGAEAGFEVVAQAGSGTEAVRLAAGHRPDVLLLDIEMPENDPPETVRRLLAQQPGLRIIVLSMYDGSSSCRSCSPSAYGATCTRAPSGTPSCQRSGSPLAVAAPSPSPSRRTACAPRRPRRATGRRCPHVSWRSLRWSRRL